MFIELVDSLRCVNDHEDTWLVATFDRMEARRIVEGALGCPVCRASYRIRDGVAWIGAEEGTALSDEPPLSADEHEHEALRLAALLDLREPGTRAVITGELGRVAHVLAAITQSELLLVDPPASILPGEGVSVVRTSGRLPLGPASMRAIALDARMADALAPRRLAPALDALRDGGRLVAPAATPVPEHVTVLARDGRQWVGARDARPSAPVQLSLVRGGRPR